MKSVPYEINLLNSAIIGLFNGDCNHIKYPTDVDINGNFNGTAVLTRNVKELSDYIISLNDQTKYTTSDYIKMIDYVNDNLDMSPNKYSAKDLIAIGIKQFARPTDPLGKIASKFGHIVYDILSEGRLAIVWILLYLCHMKTLQKYQAEALRTNTVFVRKFFAKYGVIYNLNLFGYILYKLGIIPFSDITYVNDNLIHVKKINICGNTYYTVDEVRLLEEMYCQYGVSASVIDRIGYRLNGILVDSSTIKCPNKP